MSIFVADTRTFKSSVSILLESPAAGRMIVEKTFAVAFCSRQRFSGYAEAVAQALLRGRFRTEIERPLLFF